MTEYRSEAAGYLAIAIVVLAGLAAIVMAFLPTDPTTRMVSEIPLELVLRLP